MKKYLLLIILFIGQYTTYSQEIKLDTLSVKKYGRVFNGGMTNDLVLQFVYPIGEDAIGKSIREDVTRKFFETKSVLPLEESVNQFDKTRDYYEYRNEITDLHTYLSRYSSVKITNGKVFNYIISENGCNGGTNLEQYLYYSYDLSTGSRITIDTLFSKSAQSEVVKMLRLRPDDDYEKRDIKSLRKGIDHLDNFMLLPKGLQFVYNKYEIGTGAEGEFRYTVKYSEIKYLLKPSAQQYFYR